MKCLFASALTLAACSSASVTAPAEAPGPQCDGIFSAPQYELAEQDRTPAPRLGQPATAAGIQDLLCKPASCHVLLMPAGVSDAGDTWTVVALRSGKPSSTECDEALSYALVVARAGRITRFQYLVDTGLMCMHWREEEVSVKDGVFLWRDPGYGAPAGAEYTARWRDAPPLHIDLATLTVDGCSRRLASPYDALVRHDY